MNELIVIVKFTVVLNFNNLEAKAPGLKAQSCRSSQGSSAAIWPPHG